MNPWYSLEGKTIWITGGAGYLGSPITEALDSLCKKTVLFELGGRAQALIDEKKLTRTVPYSANVLDVKTIESLVDRVCREHGVPDGVAHLAYASASSGKKFEEITGESFKETMGLALPATFLFARALADRMAARGSGSIVLFSSMYGVVSPDVWIYKTEAANPIDYGVSKAGVLQMARYLAVQYGRKGIRCNCITPGAFPQSQHDHRRPSEFKQALAAKSPLGRVGVSHEIVGPTLFLLTDGASYVTGHSLVVDGGWTVW
jgi:NAD(P)-dependent dehydrogenase (short-subunit alcohol dehydrogenase family)